LKWFGYSKRTCNFYNESAKKWSSQNRTSWTGSYTYDDAHIHDIMYTYTVHVAERQRLSTVYVVFGKAEMMRNKETLR